MAWRRLRRLEPFSRRWGSELGRPVDRYYIDLFFTRFAGDVHGAVLEIDDRWFSERYGHDVTGSDVVDIDARNPIATIAADLAVPGSLPLARYDCAIVPQTLQYVSEPRAAIANLWHALRPDGVLLITAPAVQKIDHNAPQVDRWRFNPAGLRTLLEEHCPAGDVTVVPYGNLLAASSFLAGVPAEGLTIGELDANDPEFPVLVAARARKRP